MEGSFAQAANEHGFKRSRWGRLWRQQIQDWLIATVQNVKILLKATGKKNLAVLAQRFSALGRPEHPLTLEDWVLAEKDLVNSMEAEEVGVEV